jgi:hypothetical protein
LRNQQVSFRQRIGHCDGSPASMLAPIVFADLFKGVKYITTTMSPIMLRTGRVNRGEVPMRAIAIAALAMGGLCSFQVQAQQPDPALQRLNACMTSQSRAPSSQKDIIAAMNPAINESDKVAWCFFLYVNMRAATAGNNDVLFETWASDGETFKVDRNGRERLGRSNCGRISCYRCAKPSAAWGWDVRAGPFSRSCCRRRGR